MQTWAWIQLGYFPIVLAQTGHSLILAFVSESLR